MFDAEKRAFMKNLFVARYALSGGLSSAPRQPLVVSILLIVTWSFFLFWALRYRAERYGDHRLAYMFDSDGPFQSERLIAMWANGSPLSDGFFFYGNTQHFFAFFLGMPLRLLMPGKSDFELASISLQATQLIFVFFGILALYSVAQRLIGRSLISGTLVVSFFASPSVFFWTYEIHPDMVQVASIGIFLWLCLGRDTAFPTLLAGLFLGLAIGAKYQAGLFLVFFVALQVAKHAPWRASSWREGGRKILRASLIFSVGCLVGFGGPNFSILWQPLEFLQSIETMSRQTSYGWGSEASPNPLLWGPVVYNESGFLFLLLLIVIVALALQRNLVGALKRMTSTPVFAAAGITLLLGLAYLAVAVHYRAGRYFIFLLPIVLILVSVVAAEALGRQKPLGKRVNIGLTAIFIISPMLLATNFQTLVGAVHASPADSRISAGRFVADRCAPETPLFLARYSYVPVEFSNVTWGWEVTEKDLEQSDALVLNDSIPGRYIWPRHGKLMVSDQDLSLSQAGVLAKVFREETDFVLAFEGERTRIYIRSGSEFCAQKGALLD